MSRIINIKLGFNSTLFIILLFYLGISTFDLAATVKEQDGVAEDAEVTEEEDGVYAVNFVPQKQALYIISVKHKDIHISGKAAQIN